MRLGFALSLATIASIALQGAAQAHVTPTPTFVYSGRRETITLVVPNEREVRMNGLAVTAPSGAAILDVGASDKGWPGTLSGATASWKGCCVAPGAVASFVLDLEASGEPRSVTLRVRQLYPDGEQADWPVQIAVLPAPRKPGSLTTTLAVGVLGLVVTVGVVVLAWLRRSRSLQER